ncbi:MAG: RNA polymerase sigma factor [Lishizhenia sp.]
MALRNQKYHLLTEEELLLSYKNSANNAIIGEIYTRFAHLMMGLSLNYLKDKTRAEDNVMQIFEKLPSLLMKSDVRYLKSWLYMVTKNECLMHLRKKTIDTIAIEDHLIETEPNFIAEKQLLETKIEKVYACLKNLKENQEKAIRLFYLEKKSYTEIAKLLDITEKQVKSDVQNGKRNLKLKLEKDVIFKSAK